jgi:hypothetical protein
MKAEGRVLEILEKAGGAWVKAEFVARRFYGESYIPKHNQSIGSLLSKLVKVGVLKAKEDPVNYHRLVYTIDTDR